MFNIDARRQRCKQRSGTGRLQSRESKEQKAENKEQKAENKELKKQNTNDGSKVFSLCFGLCFLLHAFCSSDFAILLRSGTGTLIGAYDGIRRIATVAVCCSEFMRRTL